MARQMGAMYMECSSKEMSGVHGVFETAVDTAVGREIQLKEESEVSRNRYSGRNGESGKAKLKRRRGCPVL